ncbi:MAG: hypothetical protein V3U65_19560 [Granulosicoccaceae bacterium]
MALELEYRWEHALVAVTIEAAAERCSECSLEKSTIQKLVYFLKILKVPMSYRFDMHPNGPSCPDIYDDIEWLLAEEVIENIENSSSQSNYKPSNSIADIKDEFKNQLESYLPIVNDVCDSFGELIPSTLQPITTLDFAYRWVKAGGGDGPWKAESVRKFKSIEKEKYSDSEIDNLYSKLVDAQLVTL